MSDTHEAPPVILDEPLQHRPGCSKQATLIYSGGQVCCTAVGCGATAKAHMELDMDPNPSGPEE